MAKYIHKKTYTCPMHPEVCLENPGNCPKCGMALECADDSRRIIRVIHLHEY